MLAGDGQPQEASLSELADGLAGERGLAIVLGGGRRDDTGGDFLRSLCGSELIHTILR